MKYIIFETPLNIPHTIIFDDGIGHHDMRTLFPANWKILGAGFFYIDEDYKMIRAKGKAFSLDIQSKPEDEDYLNNMTLDLFARALRRQLNRDL